VAEVAYRAALSSYCPLGSRTRASGTHTSHLAPRTGSRGRRGRTSRGVPSLPAPA